MSELSLEIVEGPDAGKQIALAGTLLIGRDAGSELALSDSQVSRQHARVTLEGQHAAVEDLGSSNGTFLNRTELHAPTLMSPGDELLVGVTVLQLRTAGEIASRPSAVRPVPPALARPAGTPDYVRPSVQAPGIADPSPPGPPPSPPGPPNLNALRDVQVRAATGTATLAVFVLAAFVVIIYLATQ